MLFFMVLKPINNNNVCRHETDLVRFGYQARQLRRDEKGKADRQEPTEA